MSIYLLYVSVQESVCTQTVWILRILHNRLYTKIVYMGKQKYITKSAKKSTFPRNSLQCYKFSYCLSKCIYAYHVLYIFMLLDQNTYIKSCLCFSFCFNHSRVSLHFFSHHQCCQFFSTIVNFPPSGSKDYPALYNMVLPFFHLLQNRTIQLKILYSVLAFLRLHGVKCRHKREKWWKSAK